MFSEENEINNVIENQQLFAGILLLKLHVF